MAAEAIIGPTSLPLSLEAKMETPTGGVVRSNPSTADMALYRCICQCVKMDKMANTAIEGHICGTRIRHSVYH